MSCESFPLARTLLPQPFDAAIINVIAELSKLGFYSLPKFDQVGLFTIIIMPALMVATAVFSYIMKRKEAAK